MRNIEFTHTGSSAVFGNFAAGDLLRCGADAARHFVEEARCARYTDSDGAPTTEPAAPADNPPPGKAGDAAAQPNRKPSKR